MLLNSENANIQNGINAEANFHWLLSPNTLSIPKSDLFNWEVGVLRYCFCPGDIVTTKNIFITFHLILSKTRTKTIDFDLYKLGKQNADIDEIIDIINKIQKNDKFREIFGEQPAYKFEVDNDDIVSFEILNPKLGIMFKKRAAGCLGFLSDFLYQIKSVELNVSLETDKKISANNTSNIYFGLQNLYLTTRDLVVTTILPPNKQIQILDTIFLSSLQHSQQLANYSPANPIYHKVLPEEITYIWLGIKDQTSTFIELAKNVKEPVFAALLHFKKAINI